MYMRDRFARIVFFGSIIGGTKRGCKNTEQNIHAHPRPRRGSENSSIFRPHLSITVHTCTAYRAFIHYKAPRVLYIERHKTAESREWVSLSHMPRARSLACPRGGDGVGCDLCDARKVARLERVLRHDPGAAHAEHAPG